MGELVSQRKKSTSVRVGDRVHKMTFVQTESTVINEEGLRKEVGVKVWNKITDRKVNRAKVTKAVEDGEISPEVLGTFVQVKKASPYIRHTDKPYVEGEEIEEDVTDE